MSHDFNPEEFETNRHAEETARASFVDRAREMAHSAIDWAEHKVPAVAVMVGIVATPAAIAGNAVAQEPAAGPAAPAKSDADYYEEQGKIQEAKFPPITQVIDGLEPWYADDAKRGVDPVVAEQNYANELKRGATRRSIYGAEFKPTAKPNVLRLTYHTDPATDVSGYGRVTREVTVYTKKPGQKKFHEGGSFTIKNHQAVDATRKVKIDDRLKSGGTLIARTKTTVSYEHLDGTTKSAVRRTPSTRVSK